MNKLNTFRQAAGFGILACTLCLAACTQTPTPEQSEDIADTRAVQTDSQIVAAEVVIEDASEHESLNIPDGNELDLVTEIVSIEETVVEISSEDQMDKETEVDIAASEEQAIAAESMARLEQQRLVQRQLLEALCVEIGNKLGSVSVQDCLEQNLQYGQGESVNGRPMAYRDFQPASEQRPPGRILIMGGIHGDEYSSISIMFKWMNILQQSGSEYVWRFLPAVNPDGLLDGQAIRQNASGVDLNRNFPSNDWDALAIEYWDHSTGKNPRRYPGTAAASEPETRWLIKQIEEFSPDVIVSVHAPYHLLDFDGPSIAPEKIGELYLHQLGVYPGSLGNYAGIDLGIPVVTLELPSAGIMPSAQQVEVMWNDMQNWLDERASQNQLSLREMLR